jgi:hypothetical protein
MGHAFRGVACLAMTMVTFIAAPGARAGETPVSDDEVWTGPKPHAKPVLSALEFGLTAGVSLPSGSALPSKDLSELFTAGLPIGVEAGYLRGHWFVGVSGSYARLFPKEGSASGCGLGGGCSSHSFELGAWVAYHGSPEGRSDPWIALGAGLEWATLSSPGLPAEIDTTFNGFQVVQARVGLALKRGVIFGVGPFVGLSVGQYVHASTSDGVQGTNTSMDIDNKSFHEWLTIGVRLSFDVVFVTKAAKDDTDLDAPPQRPSPSIHGR